MTTRHVIPVSLLLTEQYNVSGRLVGTWSQTKPPPNTRKVTYLSTPFIRTGADWTIDEASIQSFLDTHEHFEYGVIDWEATRAGTDNAVHYELALQDSADGADAEASFQAILDVVKSYAPDIKWSIYDAPFVGAQDGLDAWYDAWVADQNHGALRIYNQLDWWTPSVYYNGNDASLAIRMDGLTKSIEMSRGSWPVYPHIAFDNADAPVVPVGVPTFLEKQVDQIIANGAEGAVIWSPNHSDAYDVSPDYNQVGTDLIALDYINAALNALSSAQPGADGRLAAPDAREFFIQKTIPTPLNTTYELCAYAPHEFSVISVGQHTAAGDADCTYFVDSMPIDFSGGNSDGSITADTGSVDLFLPLSSDPTNAQVTQGTRLSVDVAGSSDATDLSITIRCRRAP